MIIISKIALGYCNAVILLAILLLHDENVASALLISNHQGREHGHLFPRSLGRCHATNNQEILVLPNVQPGARYDSFDGHSGQFSYHELPSSEHGFCQQVLYRENKFGKKFIGSQIFKQTKIKRVESTPRKLRGEFLTLEWVKGMIYALMVCTLIFMPFSSIESSASAIEKFTTVSSSFIGTVEDGTELGKKSNLAFKSTVETDVSLPTILRPGLPKGYFKAATKVPSESFPPGKADPTAPTPPHPPVAITTSQRYWDAQNSNNVDSIIESNMKLLDHAVGTIVNMYYDNSGGSQFAQQDLYDNWKLLKSRASTTVMNHESTRDDGQRRNDNSNAERNNRDNKGIGTGNEVVTSKATRTLHRKATPTAILSEGEIHRIITAKHLTEPPQSTFSSRESAVQGLRWLVSTLNDPYSKYLTREELREELKAHDDGFLGLGAIVEVPKRSPAAPFCDESALYAVDIACLPEELQVIQKQREGTSDYYLLKRFKSRDRSNGNGAAHQSRKISSGISGESQSESSPLLSLTRVSNLPVVTAVTPHSPSERSGIVVGDRIVAVGLDNFLGRSREEVTRALATKYTADNYAGFPDLTIAKPVQVNLLSLLSDSVSFRNSEDTNDVADAISETEVVNLTRRRVIGYRQSRVRLATSSVEPFKMYDPSALRPPSALADSLGLSDEAAFVGKKSFAGVEKEASPASLAGGNSVCSFQLITPFDSIFQSAALPLEHDASVTEKPVGYIRLTRFSRSSTVGFVSAVEALDRMGAESYIIDVRNNYGGVLQEAMLTASILLRDSATVLCYTLNSRGGFTPHDVEEYIVDTRFPGYLLSSEPRTVTLDAVRKSNPSIFKDGWSPPSSYASLHEQGLKRKRTVSLFFASGLTANNDKSRLERDISLTNALKKQKKVVILVNEGTASSAEVFASALHDNGRTVAVVGAKTFGKGLIQHTFAMPDGGGLRLTVAEYLTPALKHVTNVGSARYEKGELVGGGVKPDIYCETKGIPNNPGADICVGLALDALDDAGVAERVAKDSSEDGDILR